MLTIMGVFLLTVNTWDHRFLYSTLVFISLLLMKSFPITPFLSEQLNANFPLQLLRNLSDNDSLPSPPTSRKRLHTFDDYFPFHSSGYTLH